MKKTPPEKTRFSICVTPFEKRRLKAIAKRQKKTLSEYVLHALDFYEQHADSQALVEMEQALSGAGKKPLPASQKSSESDSNLQAILPELRAIKRQIADSTEREEALISKVSTKVSKTLTMMPLAMFARRDISDTDWEAFLKRFSKLIEDYQLKHKE